MVRIKWTIQAKENLQGIAEYIALDSVKYAKLQVARIKIRTQILKTHIRIGRITPEINNPNIRELVEGNYRIIYKIKSEKNISIITSATSRTSTSPMFILGAPDFIDPSPICFSTTRLRDWHLSSTKNESPTERLSFAFRVADKGKTLWL
jgi:plasmid stabilization system protein ParE